MLGMRVLLPWLLLRRPLRFRPHLRCGMLLRSWSLLLHSRPFLLRSGLMLRYRVLLRDGSLLLRGLLMLGNRLCLLHRSCGHDRAFLRICVDLRTRPLLRRRAHGLWWPLRLSLPPRLRRRRLRGKPVFRNLLGDSCSRYRPFSLARP